MNRKYIPRLKPLTLLVAAAFPMVALAAPSVSASASYRIDPDPYGSGGTTRTGGFNQAATGGSFDKSVVSSAEFWDPKVAIRAYSKGSGIFGASIENWVWQVSPQTAQTEIVLTDTITNNTARAQSATFDLNINSLKFVYSPGIIGWPGTDSASFSARVLVGGRTVWATSFSANPISNGVNWTATGANIGLGSAANAETCTDFIQCGFSIANYHQSLNVGPVAAWSSMTVSYVVDLSTETSTYGGDSQIYFGDPAGLSGSSDVLPAASLQFAAPVPEPEEASLMAAGLAMLGAMGARRRRKVR